jgi:large subunit ribosomal protein L28
MPRCELTGKAPEVKNLVSHSNIKTKSVALPNVQQKRLFSGLLNQMVSLKLAASTIKSIDHVGSLDKFVLNQPDAKLSKRALSLKTRMLRRLRAPAKAKTAAAPKTTKSAAKKAK